MLLILLVGAGGFVGAIMRYLVSGWVQDLSRSLSFPYGTLTVNLAGCLLIGLLAGLSEYRNVLGPETRALLLIGVLGGFTTFSSFSYETIELLRGGETTAAIANVGLQVGSGLVAVWIGYSAAKLAGGSL